MLVAAQKQSVVGYAVQSLQTDAGRPSTRSGRGYQGTAGREKQTLVGRDFLVSGRGIRVKQVRQIDVQGTEHFLGQKYVILGRFALRFQ